MTVLYCQGIDISHIAYMSAPNLTPGYMTLIRQRTSRDQGAQCPGRDLGH